MFNSYTYNSAQFNSLFLAQVAFSRTVRAGVEVQPVRAVIVTGVNAPRPFIPVEGPSSQIAAIDADSPVHDADGPFDAGFRYTGRIRTVPLVSKIMPKAGIHVPRIHS